MIDVRSRRRETSPTIAAARSLALRRLRERYGFRLTAADLAGLERAIRRGSGGSVRLGTHRDGDLWAVRHAGRWLAAVVLPEGHIRTFLTPNALNPHAARLSRADGGLDEKTPEPPETVTLRQLLDHPPADAPPPPAEPDPESPETLAALDTVPPRVVPEGRTFNAAIMKLLDGKGSVLENLSVITGLTKDSLKSRAKRVRYDYADDAIEPAADELDADEKRYYAARYKDSNNPAVREWMAQHVNAPTRRKPDARGSKDRENPTTFKRQRHGNPSAA